MEGEGRGVYITKFSCVFNEQMIELLLCDSAAGAHEKCTVLYGRRDGSEVVFRFSFSHASSRLCLSLFRHHPIREGDGLQTANDVSV